MIDLTGIVAIKTGKEYQITNYTDVWGNAEDGWNVNNQEIEDGLLHIGDDTTDEDIVNALIDLGLLKDTAEANVNVFVENTGEGWEITGNDGYPLFGLRPLYEDDDD